MQDFVINESNAFIAPNRLFTVVYGQPGVGKTSLCFTMPGPVLHYDFDKGIHRALPNPGHKSVQISAYKGFREWVFSDAFPTYIMENGIKTQAIDTVGTLLEDFIAPWLCDMNPKNGFNGSLTIQGWGALGQEFNALKTRLFSVGTELIGIAHEKEEGDGDARQVRLAVKGGSADIIYRSCDLLGYLSMRGSNRMLDFNPTQMHVGKNVAGLPSIPIPSGTDPAFNTFMQDKVITAAMKQITERNSARLNLTQKIEDLKAELDAISTPEGFLEFSARMKQEKSQLVTAPIQAAMRTRLQEAGVEWDKEAKTFVYTEEKLSDMLDGDILIPVQEPEEGKKPKKG